jgi:hypothetical protein
MHASTSRMTQEDHDDAMDAAAENMNTHNMTININQETTEPVLEHPPPARHAGQGRTRLSVVQHYNMGALPVNTAPRCSPRTNNNNANKKNKENDNKHL